MLPRKAWCHSCLLLDTPVSPITSTVADAAILLDLLSGTANFVSLLSEDVAQLRVGIARAHFFDDLHPEVASCMDEALNVVRKLVAETKDVEVPRDAFRTIFDAEIYEFHESMATNSPELYQPLTLFRVQKTAGISATDYIRECRRLKQFRADAEKIFEQVDVLITPTVPAPAPKLADLEALAIPDVRPFEMKYLLRNTAPFSSLFWPSISVPCGFSSDGLPIGMQISARPDGDSMVLRLAHAYEQATEWHKRRADDLMTAVGLPISP